MTERRKPPTPPSRHAASEDTTAVPAADGAVETAEAGEIARLRRTLDEEKERHLRVLADFDNFRRRVAREEGAAHAQGRRTALLPLLAVVDTLERALDAGSTDKRFYDGVVSTHRQLMNALREAGAETIEAEGQPFDPNLHEIVATVPSGDAVPQTVVRVARRGWRLGPDLLRPAQVVVAAGGGEGGSWP